MKSGLLWYDKNLTTDLINAIDRAAKRYREKFGVSPDTCFVNAAQLKEFGIAHRDALPSVNAPQVFGKETILRDHLWLGVSAPTN